MDITTKTNGVRQFDPGSDGCALFSVQNAALNKTYLSVDTSGNLVSLPQIGSDAAHTDSTVCQDTTTHALYSGSGAAGICLGTSSERFKHGIAPLAVGLSEIMRLQPVRYYLNPDHGDSEHLLYGFTAEQGGRALPDLMGRDSEGRPNTFDYLGVVPVLVHAIQEQQAEIEALKTRIQ